MAHDPLNVRQSLFPGVSECSSMDLENEIGIGIPLPDDLCALPKFEDVPSLTGPAMVRIDANGPLIESLFVSTSLSSSRKRRIPDVMRTLPDGAICFNPMLRSYPFRNAHTIKVLVRGKGGNPLDIRKYDRPLSFVIACTIRYYAQIFRMSLKDGVPAEDLQFGFVGFVYQPQWFQNIYIEKICIDRKTDLTSAHHCTRLAQAVKFTVASLGLLSTVEPCEGIVFRQSHEEKKGCSKIRDASTFPRDSSWACSLNRSLCWHLTFQPGEVLSFADINELMSRMLMIWSGTALNWEGDSFSTENRFFKPSIFEHLKVPTLITTVQR